MPSATFHPPSDATIAAHTTITATTPKSRKHRPWLAAIAGAVAGAVLAFVAVGLSGGSGIGGLLVCLPGMLLFALLTALPVPLDGLPYASLHNDLLWQGALIVGIGSLLFWSGVGAAVNYWWYARKLR